MKPLKRILSDPAFYGLLFLNVFFILEYSEDPHKYTSIIVLYWAQSVLIGVQTFLELFTTSNISTADFKVDGEPIDPKEGKGCYAFFFLLHYQAFHVGYLIFILFRLDISDVDFAFVKTALLGIFFNTVIVFIQHKISYRKQALQLGRTFFLPYLRIIPMHLMFLLPAFLGWSQALVFLVLKTIFDLVGHIITTTYYWKKDTEPNSGEVYV